MGVPSQPLPTIGQPNSTEDAKVRSVLGELQTILNGGIDGSNFTPAVAGQLGVIDLFTNDRRGYSEATGTTTVTGAGGADVYKTAGDAVVTVTQPTIGLTFLMAWTDTATHSAIPSDGPYLRQGVLKDGVLVTTGTSLVAINMPGTHTLQLVYATNCNVVSSPNTATITGRHLRAISFGF